MKLAILDKDGTLTKTKHGGPFPLNPQDQKLLPGVKEAIERLRSDGWTIAIASNQGGCDWHEIKAAELSAGTLFRQRHEDYGKIYKVLGVEAISTGIEVEVDTSFTETCWVDDVWAEHALRIPFRLARDARVLIQYKTIESAIEEVAFAADLCGIDSAYFCPSMKGDRLISMDKIGHIWEHSEASHSQQSFSSFGNFRKPGPGMLQAAEYLETLIYEDVLTDRLMIGDRPEDEQAAHAAGFRFLLADAWRDGTMYIPWLDGKRMETIE